ncbi:5-hydroxytryptamine receptor 1A-like [Photinus pyralis]|uniref:G-protein coupled receptors family 1 profile domain-containing protein n=1 Tax=Photinus pyralis TaxID=7054 RepID=A0A1Y1LC24_PHOPY|nr:5-hydroxytryptamine receptor 1A-like [Photinus pyralis]
MEYSTEMVQSDYSFDFESTTQQILARTIPGENQTPTSHKAPLILYDVLIPTLGTLIILLNFAVVLSSGLILKRGQQPRSTYMFLGNVALTDMVTGVAVIFGQVFPKQYRNHYVCATQLGMIVSSTLASVYSVGLIAIDRYLYILHGLQYQIWVYPTRVKVFILTSWFVGCVIGFLPLMGWYGDTDNGRVCWFILMAPKELILLTVVIGIIPLVTVIVLYSIILYRALKKIVQLSETDAETEAKVAGQSLRIFRGKGTVSEDPILDQTQSAKQSKIPKPPSKWKAIKVVVFTTSSFIITWCPYFVASLWYAYECYDVQTARCKTLRILVASPLAILGFVNSLVNPVIYAWWHKGFRKFVKRKFNRLRMIRRETREITSTARTGATNRSVLGSKSSSSSNVSSMPTASYTTTVSETMD